MLCSGSRGYGTVADVAMLAKRQRLLAKQKGSSSEAFSRSPRNDVYGTGAPDTPEATPVHAFSARSGLTDRRVGFWPV
jgi:hypothetical protein